jgi:four helix bundle protein
VRGERLEVGIKSYEDLNVYQLGYQLALQIHQLTQSFPEYERYELGQQLRKAAVSIPLNIVEGYGRQSAKAEFKHFVRNALGSSNEVIVLLKMAKDLGYIQGEELISKYDELGKQLYKLREVWK